MYLQHSLSTIFALMKMQYLISDCDGVLIDSEIIAARMMVQYLGEFDVPISMEEYISTWSGTTFKGIIDVMSAKHGFEVPENYLDDLHHRHHAIADKELQPIRGTKEAYQQIELPKALVSNSYLKDVMKAVAFTKMEDMFEGGIYSAVEVVPNPKPAPDVYFFTAEKVGVDPENIVVIEDSKSGVKSAVAAGMNVVGFTGASHILDGHDEVLLNLGAKAVIKDMADLPELVKKL